MKLAGQKTEPDFRPAPPQNRDLLGEEAHDHGRSLRARGGGERSESAVLVALGEARPAGPLEGGHRVLADAGGIDVLAQFTSLYYHLHSNSAS